MSNEVILEMKNIDKHFRGVHALDDVSFTLRRGEIHALVGENGAGKSTLMKILIGYYTPDKGEIFYKGQSVNFKSVNDTRLAGISMIFQEFNQVLPMTVMENIFLGREPKDKFGSIDYKKMYKQSKEIMQRLKANIDPKEIVGNLTVAKQQLVEIVKALSYNAEIIIMDEPTSALSSTEINYLTSIVKDLREQGKAIVFISHKMDEIYSMCDAVTVLRDGKFIHSDNVENISEDRLIKFMVDRDVNELFPKQDSQIGDVVLEVKNLSSGKAFKNIDFELRRGEILGLAGLMGAGRSELGEAITGYRKIDSGEIYLNGEKIINRIPKDAIDKGIIMVPEDRKKNGCAIGLSVKDNVLMSSIKKCLKKGYIRKSLTNKYFNEYKEKLQIKVASDYQVCANLSGGNQQKVVIARVLNADPEIIILDEPTRGIDVKTKSEIHRLMSQLACSGKSILMISSELPEILGMSDRVIVLHEGEKSGELQRSEFSPTRIMELAVGKK